MMSDKLGVCCWLVTEDGRAGTPGLRDPVGGFRIGEGPPIDQLAHHGLPRGGKVQQFPRAPRKRGAPQLAAGPRSSVAHVKEDYSPSRIIT